MELLRRCLAVTIMLFCIVANAGPEHSIVQVLVLNQSGSQIVSSGTGFSYEKGKVLTARHLFKGGPVKIRDYSGRMHDATVAASGDPDWAYVDAPSLDIPFLQLDMSNPQSGNVMAYGDFRGFGGSLESSFGNIKPSIFQGLSVHATTKTRVGFSGGPIINAHGHVVGIISKDTPLGTCLFVPISSVTGEGTQYQRNK